MMSPFRPLTLWLLGDGKTGHENQSAGLAEAMARHAPCSIHRISLPEIRGDTRASLGGVRSILAMFRSLRALSVSAELPRPDVILGAGHATHPALLWLARAHQAKSLVLMRPSLPLAWFDWCVAPTHDFPGGKARSNVILTCGALNRVVASTAVERHGRMILIGGPSGTHGWDSEGLLDLLAEITVREVSEVSEARRVWQIADSRRTPVGFMDAISHRLPWVEIFRHEETPPAWLAGKLAAAEEVWVTEDSVSMIYEALTSGAKVGLLPVPRLKRSSRVIGGIEGLIADGFLTSWADWQRNRQLKAPPFLLHEADRCAEEVIRRLTEES